MQARHDAREQLSAIALTALRIGTGAIMAAHGWQKLGGFAQWRGTVEGMGLPAPELFAALAMIAELGGGIALILGALTPLAAAGVLVVMIVAIATVHGGNGLFVAEGGWEFALVLGLISLFFLARGGGPYSVDALVGGRVRAQRDERLGRGPSAPLGGPA